GGKKEAPQPNIRERRQEKGLGGTVRTGRQRAFMIPDKAIASREGKKSDSRGSMGRVCRQYFLEVSAPMQQRAPKSVSLRKDFASCVSSRPNRVTEAAGDHQRFFG